MSLIYLKASLGPDYCTKDPRSHSKHNCRYVEVVLDLITRNREKKAIHAGEITIITPYTDQVRLYKQTFEEMMMCRVNDPYNPDDIPHVMTIDQMRGKQSRVIIFDLTVTLGDPYHSIGIVANLLRANIAVTRAEDFLIIVGSHEFAYNIPEFYAWMEVRNFIPHESKPFLLEYVEDLISRDLDFTPPTKSKQHVWFVPSTERKYDDCDHLWGRWMHRTSAFDRNVE